MSIWVNYEVQRISLDFDLGIMQLDERGVWIDRGPVDGAKLIEEYAQTCEPEALPFRWQATEDYDKQQEKMREGTTEEEQREEEIPPPDPHPTDNVQNDKKVSPEDGETPAAEKTKVAAAQQAVKLLSPRARTAQRRTPPLTQPVPQTPF
jgi:hypothetical protein